MKIISMAAIALLATTTMGAEPKVAPAIGETNPFASMTGNRFHGTWQGTTLAPNPVTITFSASGTFSTKSGFAGGGYSLNDISFSSIQGSWRRSGPRSLELVGVRYIYLPDGKLFSVERVLGSYTFGEDFDTMTGSFVFQEFVCEDVPAPPPFTVLPSCPDIQTAMPDVVRGPTASAVKRLQFVGGNP